MNLKICPKICNECPFTHKAPKVWLGPHSADEIVEAMNLDMPFSCHLVRKDDEADNIQEMPAGKQPICRGYVASASLSCKRFGQHPTYGSQMLELQRQITGDDLKQVMNKFNFKKHHSI